MFHKRVAFLICTLSLFLFQGLSAQSVQTSVKGKDDTKIFSISNNKIIQQVWIKNDTLTREMLSGQSDWLKKYHNADHAVETNGDFALKMMWTAWFAPGRNVNANVQITFTKKDFRYQSYKIKNGDDGGKMLELYFAPFDHSNTTQLRLSYQLLPGKFYTRRQIAVRDDQKESNWLDAFISRKGIVHSEAKNTDNKIVKKGAFGQPAAVDFAHGGVFFGIEYPAATTTIQRTNSRDFNLKCKEIIGTVVKNQWISSKWVVEGLAPNQYVKQWFYKYLPDIRIAKNRPYALYNSWYDLRSPAFTKVAPEHIMNQKNIMHIIDLFQKNMIEPYGIHLDAFVLDDGWDVHKSDWKLDKKTFPHGLKPISNALDKLGTTLGIWYGPTGGYSFRMDRINWMRDHGYEVIGNGNQSMLCIAGKKYGTLFQKRTTDMVKNGGVGYFKWDGLQFSCSNPTHGHPTGIYSRRAILDSLIAKCKAVRAINPKVFLNITSGTWLSPWWMKYANQIWMQGGDFGFADIPSFNNRDASMTYKDLVLYDDLKKKQAWFPISNLMTHGIIKGNLNPIGGKDDPLANFANDAMFYFARGVTMYEMYISPDLLNAGEWTVLSKSLKWAENRFPIIDNNAFMIGGDPTKGATYGYVHFKGNKGIIALRNPEIKLQKIQIHLNPAFGLTPEANSLVLERVYPDHWISPHLYSAGATINIPLSGYEAAIYEVYPLDSAKHPLLAGASFAVQKNAGNDYELNILKAGKDVKFLNPETVKSMKIAGNTAPPVAVPIQVTHEYNITKPRLHFEGASLKTELSFDQSILKPRVIIMLKPDSIYSGKAFPAGTLTVDGKKVKASFQHQKGVWAVYSYVLPDQKSEGKHSYQFSLSRTNKVQKWSGKANIWLIGQHKVKPLHITVTSKEKILSKPMPPTPYDKDAVRMTVSLGSGSLSL